MNKKNDLEYIASNFFQATCFLANYSGSRGDAIAELLNNGFSRFMKPEMEYKNVPFSIAQYFKTLSEELEYLYKKSEKEKQNLIQKFPKLEKSINANTKVSTIASKLRSGSRTERIINSICFIAFELNRLKYMDLSNVSFVSGKDFETEI